VQVLGWKAVDAWTDISVTASQTPEAPGLPDADGRQKLPVSAATFKNFTLSYKAFDTSECCYCQRPFVFVRGCCELLPLFVCLSVSIQAAASYKF
jgi:hypothetical protein